MGLACCVLRFQHTNIEKGNFGRAVSVLTNLGSDLCDIDACAFVIHPDGVTCFVALWIGSVTLPAGEAEAVDFAKRTLRIEIDHVFAARLEIGGKGVRIAATGSQPLRVIGIQKRAA